VITDVVVSTFVPPACENVNLFDGTLGLQLAAYPAARSRRAVTYRFACPKVEVLGRPGPCSGRLTLRTGIVLLGRGTFAARRPGDEDARRTVRVRLTALGRRLASRPGGVPAAVRIRGRFVPAGAWTIRLAVPRPARRKPRSGCPFPAASGVDLSRCSGKR
jgi:hypothetical protein